MKKVLSDARQTLRHLWYSVALDKPRQEKMLRQRHIHTTRHEYASEIRALAKDEPQMFCANRCPVCGCDEPENRFENRIGYGYATCPNDGTVYMDPVPSEDTLQRLYNGPAEEQSLIAPAGKVIGTKEAEYDWIRKHLPCRGERPTILDVGCSMGGFLQTASRDFDPHGVDLNASMAARARELGFDVITGRIQDVPGEGRFDLITMIQFLEHIVEPSQLIAETHRLLKPGGHVYISTPNIGSACYEFLGKHHSGLKSFKHVSNFTKGSLTALLENAGFELVAHDFYGGRDLRLSDYLGLTFAEDRFIHRASLYNARLFHFCQFVDDMTLGLLARLVFPSGSESYQKALYRKVA